MGEGLPQIDCKIQNDPEGLFVSQLLGYAALADTSA